MLATIKAYLWVMPYAIIALLVAVVFYYRYEVSEATGRAALTQRALDGAVATNAQQTKTITALIELRKEADKIVSDLADSVATINKSVTDQSAALADLKEADPDVKSFTNGIVPDGLKRLHNR